MSRVMPPARRFGSESPVLTYWLARCEGFRVAGPRRLGGSVEGVVYEDGVHAGALVVRSGPVRRIVPVAEVESVSPAVRTVTLRPVGREQRAILGPAARAGAASLRAGVGRMRDEVLPRARSGSILVGGTLVRSSRRGATLLVAWLAASSVFAARALVVLVELSARLAQTGWLGARHWWLVRGPGIAAGLRRAQDALGAASLESARRLRGLGGRVAAMAATGQPRDRGTRRAPPGRPQR